MSQKINRPLQELLDERAILISIYAGPSDAELNEQCDALRELDYAILRAEGISPGETLAQMRHAICFLSLPEEAGGTDRTDQLDVLGARALNSGLSRLEAWLEQRPS